MTQPSEHAKMIDTRVRCKCGGILEFKRLVRYAYIGKCRDCGEEKRTEEYGGMEICLDCNALYMPEDGSRCPCREEDNAQA